MRKLILAAFFIALFSSKSSAQSHYQPYSFSFYQKLSRDIYNKNTRFHSSLRPLIVNDSLLVETADSLLGIGVDTNRRGWIPRKLFNEHLIDVRKREYTAYLDFLPDFMVGKTGGKSTWLNTRGFQIGGTIGKNFYFYTSGYENQGEFANYYTDYVNRAGVVPGQSYDRNAGINAVTKDWSYASALISYTPVKYLNITIGQDKNFIGDGYRSMLLSDYTSNYPFLKLTGNLGNVQYMAIWAALQEPQGTRLSYDSGNRRKGGVFHYLDWNVNDRLSLGFFDAVIWSQFDDDGNKRGFDWGYASPIIFLRPNEAMSGSPDNAAMGLTAKYEVLDKTALYGQFFLDEFTASEFFSKTGSNRNKYGVQLGLRGADLLKVNSLNYLLEFNTARPYTYSSRKSDLNSRDYSMLTYGHYNEPLAHPYGANFKELVGILSWSYNRFDFQGQFNFAKYGLDVAGETVNYGKNIYRPYNTEFAKRFDNTLAQGNTTTLNYLDLSASYLLNPKYNLRFELRGIVRNEKQEAASFNTNWITFGLRSSFRNLYQDF